MNRLGTQATKPMKKLTLSLGICAALALMLSIMFGADTIHVIKVGAESESGSNAFVKINSNFVAVAGRDTTTSNGITDFYGTSFSGSGSLVRSGAPTITGNASIEAIIATDIDVSGEIHVNDVYVEDLASISTLQVVGTYAAINTGATDSGTNAFFIGRTYFDLASRTNHSTSGNYTNLACYTNAVHSLTNAGDTQIGECSGNMLSGTNKFVLGYSSITNILDISGLTNGHPLATWSALLRVTRLPGSNLQRVYAEWKTDPGFGIQFSYTNRTVDIAETNSLANVMRLQGSAIRAGGITNNYLSVKFEFASR
jgi:hypothetical protein